MRRALRRIPAVYAFSILIDDEYLCRFVKTAAEQFSADSEVKITFAEVLCYHAVRCLALEVDDPGEGYYEFRKHLAGLSQALDQIETQP